MPVKINCKELKIMQICAIKLKFYENMCSILSCVKFELKIKKWERSII